LFAEGVTFAAKHLLSISVALLSFRLATEDPLRLGIINLLFIAVCAIVKVVFGKRPIGRDDCCAPDRNASHIGLALRRRATGQQDFEPCVL
jgi:hypothetical protein